MSKKKIDWPGFDDNGNTELVLPVPVADNHCHLDMIIDYVNDLNNEITEKNNQIIEQAKIASQTKGYVPKKPTALLPLKSYEDICNQSLEANVRHLVHSCCEVEGLENLTSLNKLENCFFAVAIHPNEAVAHSKGLKENSNGEVVNLDEAISKVYDFVKQDQKNENPKVVAIGETGLDVFRSEIADLDIQKQSLGAHIDIANEFNLPIQIHSRQTNEIIIQYLSDNPPKVPVVFHSYSGDSTMATHLANLGFYLSFSGPLTFKSNDLGRQAFMAADSNFVLVETDAPYLTPEPFRSRVNASWMCAYIVQKMSELKGETLDNMCNILWSNHCKLYGLG